MRGLTRASRLILVVAVTSLSLSGCVRGCPSSRPPVHLNPNMDDQPRYEAQSESGFFYNGSTMRQPVPGTVARGELRDDPTFFEGRDRDGGFLAESPVPLDEELAERGAQRYGIYCAPCHDNRGTGQGILAERGGVPTADLHDDRLVAMPDGELFDVITNGKGLMQGYRYPVPTEDRWAIVAHVRRLQRESDSSRTR
jgi:mono/diheme cytochrome c family protein